MASPIIGKPFYLYVFHWELCKKEGEGDLRLPKPSNAK